MTTKTCAKPAASPQRPPAQTHSSVRSDFCCCQWTKRNKWAKMLHQWKSHSQTLLNNHLLFFYIWANIMHRFSTSSTTSCVLCLMVLAYVSRRLATEEARRTHCFRAQGQTRHGCQLNEKIDGSGDELQIWEFKSNMPKKETCPSCFLKDKQHVCQADWRLPVRSGFLVREKHN